ncbi:MAG: aldose 1-epimerase [Leeuwenhoekiella sp.]
MLELKSGHLIAKIDQGELVSFREKDHEYIHQKGDPGWGSSDTEMFPIIGPTAEADYKVLTPEGYSVQDQHGLLRAMHYEVETHTETSAVYIKNYKANESILNPKFPRKSKAEFMSWPYDFSFKKEYTLSEKGLQIDFLISGPSGMPFMLGYHPAFKLKTSKPYVTSPTTEYILAQIMDVGDRAIHVPDCDSMVIHDARELTIRSEGYGHFMLWSPARNMVCVEPVTFYPYDAPQDQLHKGFQTLSKGQKKFTVTLEVGKKG